MKGIVCKVCWYIAINGNAPDKCPVCGAPKTSFEEKQEAIKTAQDSANMTEAEKKHTPAITVVRTCGLIPDNCIDVHVKIGEIQHPMQDDHYILHIDFYIDSEFVSRVVLTPQNLNPAAALHLKTKSGKLTAIELCSVHGAWINGENL